MGTLWSLCLRLSLLRCSGSGGRYHGWGSLALPGMVLGHPQIFPPSHSPDINVVLRKLVCLLKPDKEIIHTGDHMVIRTITSLRDYVMDFDLGVQFEEDLGPVDGRKCQTTVSWEGDQLVCEQLGEKRNRGWRHWLEGDQLHLVRRGPAQLAKPQSGWAGGGHTECGCCGL